MPLQGIVCRIRFSALACGISLTDSLKFLVEFVEIDVCQDGTYNSSNNIAKNVIDFSIAIPRERLRPNYGDGFKGAPLDTFQSSRGTVDQNRGVNRNEPKPTKEEVDCASEI